MFVFSFVNYFKAEDFLHQYELDALPHKNNRPLTTTYTDIHLHFSGKSVPGVLYCNEININHKFHSAKWLAASRLVGQIFRCMATASDYVLRFHFLETYGKQGIIDSIC